MSSYIYPLFKQHFLYKTHAVSRLYCMRPYLLIRLRFFGVDRRQGKAWGRLHSDIGDGVVSVCVMCVHCVCQLL